MRAQELRIGNYTSYGRIIALEINDADIGFVRTDKREKVKLYLIKPVPLTEDWLSRFEFIKSEDYDKNPGWYAPSRLPIYLTKENEVWSENGYNITIKYVHQLQNLFYALTGEELTIKHGSLQIKA